MPRLGSVAAFLLSAASSGWAELGSGALGEPAAGKVGANSPPATRATDDKTNGSSEEGAAPQEQQPEEGDSRRSGWETYLPSVGANYAKAFAGSAVATKDAKGLLHSKDAGNKDEKRMPGKEEPSVEDLAAASNAQDDQGAAGGMPFMDYMPADQGAVKRLQTKLQDTEGQLRQSEEARQRAEAANEKLRARLRESEDAREKVEDEVQDRRRELGRLQETVRQKDAQLQELQREKSRLGLHGSIAAARADTNQEGPTAKPEVADTPSEKSTQGDTSIESGADHGSLSTKQDYGSGQNMGYQQYIPFFGLSSTPADASNPATGIDSAALPVLLLGGCLALLSASVASSRRVFRSQPGPEDSMGVPFLGSERMP